MLFKLYKINKSATIVANIKANKAPLTPKPNDTNNIANIILPRPSIDKFIPNALKFCNPCNIPLETERNK